MTTVEYTDVTKRYGDELAIEEVNLTVEDGEFAILLGPSGCGKTTTLRCLAGLTEPTEGTIEMDGFDVTDIHPKNRNAAMVFQNFALYPHMTVRENIAYPLKVHGVDKESREERVQEVTEMMEMSELLDRDIDNLSGGQQQRVALGRAIIRRPSVFLMDEPLANLDAKLKMSMRSRIKVLQRELGITTLYVTHDQEEAMSLGDKLVVMNDAHIQQIGTPDEVYHEPVNKFVAGFIGSPAMNFVDVTIDDDGVVRATKDVEGFEYRLNPDVARRYEDYDELVLGVRPQYFEINTDPIDNAIEAEVEVTEPQGDEQIVDVIIGEEYGVSVDLTVVAPNTTDISRGDRVYLTVDDMLAHGFDPRSGDRIGEVDVTSRTKASKSATERTSQTD